MDDADGCRVLLRENADVSRPDWPPKVNPIKMSIATNGILRGFDTQGLPEASCVYNSLAAVIFSADAQPTNRPKGVVVVVQVEL